MRVREKRKTVKKSISHLILQTVIEDLCKYMRVKNEERAGERAKALNLNTLKSSAFEYINNFTINQVICDFFFILFFIDEAFYIEFFFNRDFFS